MHLQEAVPLEELWQAIERHSGARRAVAATEQALADRAQQHRAVQKRLLMRFKDRQPTSLAHLDLLLGETFHQVLELGQRVQASVCLWTRYVTLGSLLSHVSILRCRLSFGSLYAFCLRQAHQ